MQPVAPACAKRPAVHVLHDMWSTSNFPGAQTVQVNSSAFFDPSAHVVHSPELVPPQPVRISPPGHLAHGLQALSPVMSWNS